MVDLFPPSTIPWSLGQSSLWHQFLWQFVAGEQKFSSNRRCHIRVTARSVEEDPTKAGSGIISMNGAAAHKASPGDRVIICAYGNYTEAELMNHKPALVYLKEGNEVSHSANAIPVQVA